jgi:ketose-bisphosphate aldolase
MKFTHLNIMLDDARKNHYAVGAFNIINLETLRAVVNAAEAENMPVILQIWYGDLYHPGAPFVGAMAQTAAATSSVPLGLQLDHGQSLEQVRTCIECGFSSVMIDCSSTEFFENIIMTKKIVEEAHARGITVEAELGKIFGGSEPVEVQTSALTDPDLALRFVKETGIDALAVSVGTAHGFYAAKPDIRMDLLKKLIHLLPVPIVVHGGSGIPDIKITEMVKLGITKLNVGTDLMATFKNSLKEILIEKESLNIRDVLEYAQKQVEKTVRKYIRLLNTN